MNNSRTGQWTHFWFDGHYAGLLEVNDRRFWWTPVVGATYTFADPAGVAIAASAVRDDENSYLALLDWIQENLETAAHPGGRPLNPWQRERLTERIAAVVARYRKQEDLNG